MKYKIFLAWQSQNRTTSKFIKAQLKKSVALLSERGYDIVLIERPTQEDSGAPNINSVIWEQISDSDVFIADISNIIQNDQTIISNPNVMYELGIAEALLGAHRTILLCDENTPVDKVAFDINHNRISSIKTSNTNLFIDLADWLESALIEADKERYIKTYCVETFLEDLILITNYFYCLSNIRSQIEKCPEFPTLDTIRESLTTEQYSSLFVNVDFNNLICIMEDKLQKLYAFSHKKLIWYVINIIKVLKDYQFILDNQKESPWTQELKKTANYIMLDKKSFFIKDVSDAIALKMSVYLNSNVVIYGDGTRLFATDKRLFKNLELRYQNITLESGEEMTMVNTKLFSLKPELVETFTQCIYNIFHSLEQFFDYCNIELCLTDDVGEYTGMIVFKNK